MERVQPTDRRSGRGPNHERSESNERTGTRKDSGRPAAVTKIRPRIELGFNTNSRGDLDVPDSSVFHPWLRMPARSIPAVWHAGCFQPARTVPERSFPDGFQSDFSTNSLEIGELSVNHSITAALFESGRRSVAFCGSVAYCADRLLKSNPFPLLGSFLYIKRSLNLG